MHKLLKDAWFSKQELELLSSGRPVSWQFNRAYGGMSGFAWPVPDDQPWYKARQPWTDRPIEPWMRPHMPQHVELGEECQFEPWGVASGFIIVNQAVRAIIEKLEPSVHQFLDVSVAAHSNNEPRVEPYFVVLFGTDLLFDDFVDESSDCEMKEYVFPERTVRFRLKKHAVPLRLKRSAIQGLQLWRASSVERFMAMALYDELWNSGLLGGLEIRVNEVVDE